VDLQDIVALSVITGLTRSRAFAAYKHLRVSEGEPTLEDVIACAGRDADVEHIALEARARATVLVAAAARARIEIIRSDGEKYPALLREIYDPPPVLWLRGDVRVFQHPAIAIVGSRAASAYALEVASRLAAELAARGVLVVSGLARGADAAAHRGCLDAGGVTLGVLGSGLDRIYPPEHDLLAEQICRSGAIVSELAPDAPPLPDHFPARNRLISGISLAVVVVEANEKSGSLITARFALEQGREVMAVPGSVLGGRNRGSHALLKDGAKVVETADDILEALGPQAPAVPKISGNSLQTDELLQKLTPGQSYDPDEMSATVGLTGSRLLARLTEWEMNGRLTKVAGGRYVLAGRN